MRDDILKLQNKKGRAVIQEIGRKEKELEKNGWKPMDTDDKELGWDDSRRKIKERKESCRNARVRMTEYEFPFHFPIMSLDLDVQSKFFHFFHCGYGLYLFKLLNTRRGNK